MLDYLSLQTADGGLEAGLVNLTLVFKPLNLTSEQARSSRRLAGLPGGHQAGRLCIAVMSQVAHEEGYAWTCCACQT